MRGVRRVLHLGRELQNSRIRYNQYDQNHISADHHRNSAEDPRQLSGVKGGAE
jgi:hypothetical protein